MFYGRYRLKRFLSCFPLMCRVLRRTSFLSALLFIFVLLGPFARSKAFNHNPVWREYSYLGGMDGIALGSLTALFSAKVRLAKMKLRVVGIAGAMVLVSILCFSIRADRWGLGRDGLRRRNGRLRYLLSPWCVWGD